MGIWVLKEKKKLTILTVEYSLSERSYLGSPLAESLGQFDQIEPPTPLAILGVRVGKNNNHKITS